MVPRLGERRCLCGDLGEGQFRTHSVVVVHVGSLLNRCPGGDVDPGLRREAGLEAGSFPVVCSAVVTRMGE